MLRNGTEQPVSVARLRDAPAERRVRGEMRSGRCAHAGRHGAHRLPSASPGGPGQPRSGGHQGAGPHAQDADLGTDPADPAAAAPAPRVLPPAAPEAFGDDLDATDALELLAKAPDLARSSASPPPRPPPAPPLLGLTELITALNQQAKILHGQVEKPTPPVPGLHRPENLTHAYHDSPAPAASTTTTPSSEQPAASPASRTTASKPAPPTTKPPPGHRETSAHHAPPLDT